MIEDGMLGFVNSCYQLGSIFGVPLAPWVAKKYGRRWSIMIGSWIMVVGALMQGWAQHGKHVVFLASVCSLTNQSWHVHCRPYVTRSRYSVLYHFWSCHDRRISRPKGETNHDLTLQLLLVPWSNHRFRPFTQVCW